MVDHAIVCLTLRMQGALLVETQGGEGDVSISRSFHPTTVLEQRLFIRTPPQLCLHGTPRLLTFVFVGAVLLYFNSSRVHVAAAVGVR